MYASVADAAYGCCVSKSLICNLASGNYLAGPKAEHDFIYFRMAGDPEPVKSTRPKKIPKHILKMLKENDISRVNYRRRIGLGWTRTRAAGGDI